MCKRGFSVVQILCFFAQLSVARSTDLSLKYGFLKHIDAMETIRKYKVFPWFLDFLENQPGNTANWMFQVGWNPLYNTET